jgi:hypothetical protein
MAQRLGAFDDSGHISAFTLLDLSSAFDTVDLDVLLSTLHHRSSIDQTALNWLYIIICLIALSLLSLSVIRLPLTQLHAASPEVQSSDHAVEFISYTEHLTCLFDRLHIPFRFFAYMTHMQVYKSVRPSDVSDCRQCLSAWVADVAGWYASRHLQQLRDGNYVVWAACHSAENCRIEFDSHALLERKPSSLHQSCVDVLLDPELGMWQHTAKVATDCFFQLRRLRQPRQRIGQDVTTRPWLRLDWVIAIICWLVCLHRLKPHSMSAITG